MAQKRKITDKNLYELLEVLSSATEQDIKKAYRKKALKCHPDKNPDNPKATELFHELSEALQILTDEKAKAAYDRTLKAKEQAKERHRELDSKRKKFKEDLERRENAAREGEIARAAAKKSYSATPLSEEESFQKEVDRLRKEGSRALQEEQELIRQQILKEQQGKFSFLSAAKESQGGGLAEGPRLKVKWLKKDGGSYPRSYTDLMNIYGKYGNVTTLVVGKKTAIVEYQNQSDADKAYEEESNNEEVQLEWLSKVSRSDSPKSDGTKPANSSSNNSKSATTAATPLFPSAQTNPVPVPVVQPMSTSSFADFEAMILGKLSAAAAAQKGSNGGDSN